MAKSNSKRDAEIALASSMLRELEFLRERGGEAYPPTLRQLAALAGSTADEPMIQTAANKQVFTARAVVTDKPNKKPSLDSPVFLKGDEPKPDGGKQALQMLAVLEAQRRLGEEAYPLTLRRLAELSNLKPNDPFVKKAVKHKNWTGRAAVAAKGKSMLDLPVVLREDVEGDIRRVLPALLKFALAITTNTVKGKAAETTAFSLTDIKGRLVPDLQKPVLAGIERGIEQNGLPGNVAWVLSKGKPYLFLAENTRPKKRENEPTPPPQPPQAPRDFAQAFREAFDQLDRRNGATNFVKLIEMRRALLDFGRVAFDSGLRELRLTREFSLESHEGMHGPLTAEEREAGVHEAGSLLVYVSRR